MTLINFFLTIKRQDFFNNFLEKLAFYGLDTCRAGTGTVTFQKSEPEP
jgi:hypothetical protein